MLAQLPFSTQRWRFGELSDAAYAGLYFLHWQLELHGSRCAARKAKQSPRPDPHQWLAVLQDASARQVGQLLCQWLGNYQFLGVIPNVTEALCAWLRREWDLQLYERIPSPLEVLSMQTEGRRPITVLSEFPRLRQPVLSKPNAYAFMIHDLEHAWKFHHDPQLHQSQIAFFAALHAAIERGLFASRLNDRVFAEKFDYLMSDMNTHPAHSRQYLKAILIERQLKAEGKTPHDQLSPDGFSEIVALLESAGLADQNVTALVCRT